VKPTVKATAELHPGESPDRSSATVSVVVPSYNHAPFVGRCLRSIISQRHTPHELIVIDDGSTDGSLEQIEAVLRDCPFASELTARPNRGLAATLNEGLKRSRGEYFAYLSSDDVWLNGFLQERIDLLQSRPKAVLAYGHVLVINEDDQILESSSDWADYRDGQVTQMLLHHTAPISPAVVYRRRALERQGWNEEAKLEDYDLYLRLSGDGEFAFDPRELCAWRRHGYNASHDVDFMLNECLKAQRRVADGLNIDSDELDRAQSELKWRYARDYIKAGKKREALGLILQNLKSAPSFASIAGTMLGLFVPQSLIEWRGKRMQQRGIERHGTLPI
jgi:alpha-1,3-rhamnosyltransferase